MQDDLRAFIAAVKAAAQKHRVGAFVVSGAVDAGGSNVAFGTLAEFTFDGKSEAYREHCLQALEEAIQSAVDRALEPEPAVVVLPAVNVARN